AWDPAWSIDGTTLAWHEWDLPNMPWDGSRIMSAMVDRDDAPRLVAGGDDVAVGQPRFSPVGATLAFVSEARGWMNVWLAPSDGSAPLPLLEEPHEHAEPAWGPGQRSFAWSPDGRAVVVNRNEDGFARLVQLPIAASAPPVAVSRGWHAGLDWGPAGIVCIRSGGRTAPQLTVLDPVTGGREA